MSNATFKHHMGSNAWQLIHRFQSPEGHVVPVDDLKVHILTPECWCCPAPDDDYPHVLIHKSMDRREEFENGREPS